MSKTFNIYKNDRVKFHRIAINSYISFLMDVDTAIVRAGSKADQLHTPFQRFMEQCELSFSRPVHSFTEMSMYKTTKAKGNLFEEFCIRYLLHRRNCTQAWLLADIPEEIRESLKLGTRDVGIDIVAMEENNYVAVQCKYKKDKKPVTWKELSTFYSLCARTGPWKRHIVMTTGTHVLRKGVRQPQDLSICFGSFNRLTSAQWLTLTGDKGYRLGEAEEENKEEEIIQEMESLSLRSKTLHSEEGGREDNILETESMPVNDEDLNVIETVPLSPLPKSIPSKPKKTSPRKTRAKKEQGQPLDTTQTAPTSLEELRAARLKRFG